MTERVKHGVAAPGQWGRAFRRRLPFGRAAVLVADGRHHVVGVADVSTTGAFLITRAHIVLGTEHVLKILPIPGKSELRLPVRIVRIAQSGEETPHHPHGVAVQFEGLDERSRGILEEYVQQPEKRKP